LERDHGQLELIGHFNKSRKENPSDLLLISPGTASFEGAAKPTDAINKPLNTHNGVDRAGKMSARQQPLFVHSQSDSDQF
jgi:hypothetical protein